MTRPDAGPAPAGIGPPPAHPLPFALPDRVAVNEVGPRDGFQLEKRVIPTADKIAVIDALAATGVAGIQVTSFVRPDAVPQLTDADAVIAGIRRDPAVIYTVLVPNMRGAQRALAHPADGWELMLSTTDSHSIANSNRPTADVLDRLGDVVALAREHHVAVGAGLATALGCPFEGRVPYGRVAWVVGRLHDMGLRHITVSDTVGVADPALVFDVCTRLGQDFPDVTVALHLHDTRGLALADVLAGMAAGVREFDSSVGGLGGCPFAPGATGNVATEDLVHMLALLGVDTGVDLGAILDIARTRVAPLIDHPLESALARSGPSWDVHAAPPHQVLPHPAAREGRDLPAAQGARHAPGLA